MWYGRGMSTTLEERLQHLETSNRRLRNTLIGACSVALLAILFGQGSPPDGPRTLTVRGLNVVDGSGRVRAAISANDDGSACLLRFNYSNNKHAMVVGVAGNNPGVTCNYPESDADKAPSPAITLGLDGHRNTPLIAMKDLHSDSTLRAVIESSGEPGLVRKFGQQLWTADWQIINISGK